MANYEEKTLLMDEATSKRAVSRIAYEIVERNRGTENLVIIGIQTKGVSLAKLIIKKIEEIEGIKLELGSLDITFYRDDLTRLSKHPVVAGNDIAFSIEDKKIILVDDVLYSGRTIRAAMEELFDMGRMFSISFALMSLSPSKSFFIINYPPYRILILFLIYHRLLQHQYIHHAKSEHLFQCSQHG